LIKSVKFEELFLLLVIVVGTDKYDNENSKEDSEALNPCYIIIISTFIIKRYARHSLL
jgi:hypothetical protein